MPSTSYFIQQGTPVVAQQSFTVLGTATAGTTGACRRLVFPTGVVDGNGTSVVLAPITYGVANRGTCLNPTRTLNMDNCDLVRPRVEVFKTEGSTRLVRFEETTADVLVTEIWEPRGGASMPTSFFRLLYDYFFNAQFIDSVAGPFIQYEPQDKNAKTFDVDMVDLRVGDDFEINDILGGDPSATTPDYDNVLSLVSPVPTGLIDREVRLVLRLIADATP